MLLFDILQCIFILGVFCSNVSTIKIRLQELANVNRYIFSLDRKLVNFTCDLLFCSTYLPQVGHTDC